MGQIKAIQDVLTAGNTTSDRSIAFADFLAIKLEGKALKIREQSSSTETQTVAATSFQYYSRKPFYGAAGQTIYLFTTIISGSTKQQVFKVGSNVVIPSRYYLYDNTNLNPTTFDPVTGEDNIDVLQGLKVAVIGKGYSNVTTATVSIINETLTITGDLTMDFTPDIDSGTDKKYKSGLYCTVNGSDYLLDIAESNISMPTTPALAASYDFTTSTALPSGISAYLYDSGYSVQSFTTGSPGNTDITNVPLAGSSLPTDGDTVYVGGGLLSFAVDLTGLVLTILYKQ